MAEGDIASLPQWAQDLIRRLRAEAAAWRVKAREAEARAKDPQTTASRATG